MELHIAGHPRHATFPIECTARKIEPRPGFRKALEAVEAMHRATANAPGDEPDGPAGEYSEFQVMSLDLDRSERKFDELALTVEAERVWHGALDVIDAALQRPQRALTHGVNAPHIGSLIEATDDLIEERLELEIGHKHRAESLACWS